MTRTPKRRLTFQVVDETPVPGKDPRKCVLVQKPAGTWVPALINDEDVDGNIQVSLSTGEQLITSDCRLFILNKNDAVRFKGDSRSFSVVSTHCSSGSTPYRLNNGDNMVELVPKRGHKTLKVQVNKIFLHDVEHLPVYERQAVRPETKLNGSPQRQHSVMGPPPLAKKFTLASELFKHHLFVVGDQYYNPGVILENGGTITDVASLFIEKRCTIPSQFTFFAVLGTAIAPTSPFLECLALGWPCLSLEFIEESIERMQVAHWQNYLLPIVCDGVCKSQNISNFERQWAMGHNLVRQYEYRNIICGPVIPPVYVDSECPALVARLLALVTLKTYAVEKVDQVPAGCIFISATAASTSNFNSKTRLEMLQQPRTSENSIVLTSRWVVQTVLSQSV